LLRQFLVHKETVHNDHANFALCQIGQLGGQPTVPSVRPAIFEVYISTFDKAAFPETLEERYQGRGATGRSAIQIANHRHGALLRACGTWPSCRAT
jgi:hypothetical protein